MTFRPPNTHQQIINYAGITWDSGLPDFWGGFDGGWSVYNSLSYATPVSPPNYAYNSYGAIDPGFSFASHVTFNGAYFMDTSASDNPSAVRFVGYVSGVPTYYSGWLTLSSTPAHLSANFPGVDRVVVEMDGSGWFAMDDLSYEPFGTPTVSIYTDATSYTTGDTMHVGLDVTNPGDAQDVRFAIWLEKPDGGIYVHTYTSITLPAGLDYSNSNFAVFTLPSIPAGTYTWNAAIIEPSGPVEFISHDIAEWEFGPAVAGAPTEDVLGMLEQTTVAIDFGE